MPDKTSFEKTKHVVAFCSDLRFYRASKFVRNVADGKYGVTIPVETSQEIQV